MEEAATHNDTLADMPPGPHRDALADQNQKRFQAADDNIAAADAEARSLHAANPERAMTIAKLRELRATLSALRTAQRYALDAHRRNERMRDDLLARATPEQRREAEVQGQRLVETTTRMQRGADKLRHACQVAVETEAVGANILSDLDGNRRTLEQTRERLRGANRGLAQSRRVLQAMTRRALANKVLMYVIIASMVLMILLIIWMKWFWSPPSPSPPPAPPSAPPSL